MRLRIIAPDGTTSERDVAPSTIRLGRDPSCEVPFESAVYPQVSGLHARIEQTATGVILTPLSRSNKTLLNDEPVEGPTPVRVADRIRLGLTGPTVEIVAVSERSSKVRGGEKPRGYK